MPRAVLVLSLICLLAVPAAASAAKPDLVVTQVSAGARAAAGATLAVNDTVKARGKVRKFVVGYALLRDGKRTALTGTRAVKRVKPGRCSRGSRTVTVPASVAAGAYRVVACADARKQVRERNERNNCRTAKGSVTVSVAAPAPGGGGQTPSTTPAPLKVVPQRSQSDAVTQVVSAADGGTVTATGPDGSSYTLELPPGALLSDQAITMTPLAGVDGLPFSFAAGVDLGPDGLVLLEPATLTIAPATDIPVDHQIAFGYHGNGEELHLELPAKAPEVRLSISHFSGYGVASGTGADIAAQQGHPPTRSIEQFQQSAADIVRRWRDGTADPAEIFPLMKAWFTESVKPHLVAATTDDALGVSAIAEGVAFERQLELMGGGDAELEAMKAQILPLVQEIIRHAFEVTYARCVDGDVNMAPRLLAFERTSQLFNLQLDAVDKLFRCLRFELDFTGTFSETDPFYFVKTASLKAQKLPIELGNGIAGPLTLRGQGTVTHTGWSIDTLDPEGCRYVPAGSTNGTMIVGSLDLVLNLRTEMVGSREVLVSETPKVSMRMSPGLANESSTLAGDSCPGGTFDDYVYTGVFEAAHATEEVVPWYDLRGWQVAAGGAFAQRAYGYDDGQFAEQSLFELRHAPQP